jgi:hypothetical protein
MTATRIALIAGALVSATIPLSQAGAVASVATQQVAENGTRVDQEVTQAQGLQGRLDKKRVILGLFAILSALDIYEILRHHHHATQPVSP